jgi:uncharacterized protein YdaU (DUF1376 family)
MHFYRHNIGDYRRDTAHLSLLEHGVYRQLIDTYYLNEQPIPADLVQVCRKLLARTDEERRAVELVLNEFFTLTEQGWVHTRCDAELAAYHERAEKARENGRKGGRPVTHPEPDGNQSGIPMGTESGGEPKANHKPETNNQKPETKTTAARQAAPVDMDLFLGFWSQYPRKVAKPEAVKAWVKLKPDADLADAIMAGLRKAKASRDWLKDDGQYIPHPSTWLNQRRWEDQLDAAGDDTLGDFGGGLL